MKGISWLVVVEMALAPVVLLAGSAEDDLAVVKKAVTAPKAAAAEKPDKLRWLRVRVTEKAGKRVSINLPLAFARALGDDWPVDIGCARHGRSVTLGEVLRTLQSGQDLVQVDSDDATVRVWVE